MEELLDHATDAVLLLNGVAVASLGLKGVLEVLFLADLVIVGVHETKTEITNGPEEGGEQLVDLFGVTLTQHFLLYLELLGQIDDQAQRVNGILVYGVHRVEDERTAQKQCQKEDFCIVVDIFVKCSNTFRVNDQSIKFFPTIGGLYRLTPHPQPLRAGINSWSHSEA